MKRLWSELSGMNVCEADSRKVLGSISGAFLDPENGTLIAFLVGVSRAITPSDIIKWGKNELLVADEEVFSSPFDLHRLENFGLRRCYFLGKKVLSKSGDRIGKVRDFTLETLGTSLVTFEVSRGFLWLRWDKRIFAASDIQEITETTIVLNLDPQKPSKAKTEKLRKGAKLEIAPAI